jgi:hypothetical protein
MAANTFDTTNPGSAVSNRESLHAGFYLIAPEQIPLTAALSKIKAKAVKEEWTCDDLDTPTLTATPEGADATSFDNKGKNRARVGNYITIREETAQVTDLQERVDNAVTASEKNTAIERCLIQLARKVEAAALSETAASSSDPRQAAGFGEMLGGASTVFAAGASEYNTPAASVIASGAPTEQAVNGVLRSIFTQSGQMKNLRVFADPTWVNSFTENTVRLAGTPTNNKLSVNIDGSKYRVDMKVRIYNGPHGLIELVDNNPACSAVTRSNLDRAFFIDTNMAAIAEFAPKREEPTDGGGGWRCVFKRYFTFIVRNGRAHGYWKTI